MRRREENLKKVRWDCLINKRLDGRALKISKGDLGSDGFSKQFGQQPIDLEGNEVKRSWLNIMPYHKLPRLVKEKVRDFTVDTADKEKESNDASGWLSYCEYKGYLFLFDFHKMRATFGRRVESLMGFVKKNGQSNSRVYIEPKSSGTATYQYMRDYTDLNVMEWKMAEGDKMVRLRSVTPNMEAGKLVLIEGSWNEEFILDVCGFPNREDKEAVDCLSMAGINTWLRKIVQGYKYVR